MNENASARILQELQSRGVPPTAANMSRMQEMLSSGALRAPNMNNDGETLSLQHVLEKTDPSLAFPMSPPDAQQPLPEEVAPVALNRGDDAGTRREFAPVSSSPAARSRRELGTGISDTFTRQRSVLPADPVASSDGGGGFSLPGIAGILAAVLGSAFLANRFLSGRKNTLNEKATAGKTAKGTPTGVPNENSVGGARSGSSDKDSGLRADTKPPKPAQSFTELDLADEEAPQPKKQKASVVQQLAKSAKKVTKK